MAIPATQLADCQIITKAFERGCNFSTKEESVFAVMAPSICTMRNLAKSTNALIKENPISDVNSSKSLADRWTEGGLSGTDCIPCNLRIDFKEQLTFQSSIQKMYQYYYQYFQNALKQIQYMTDLLTGKDKTLDICPLINFFKEFMCVPDLNRLIAALTALMMQFGLELSSLFDLVLQLIGPIMMPFLNEVINQVNQFFLNAIKPLECIINTITTHLSKLDYGALFNNPTNVKIAGTLQTGTVQVTKSKIDLNPIATNQAQKDHLKVLQAEQELNKVQAQAKNLNPLDAANANAQRQKEQEAKQKYQEALRNKDLSAIGKTNAELNKFLNSTKSALLNLIKYIKMVVDKFNSFQDKLVGDFVKMLNTLIGGGTGLLIQLQDKLAVTQLISLIKGILKIYKNGLQCDIDGNLNDILPVLPLRADMNIYEDADGNIHMDQNTSEIDAAIDNAILGLGKNPDNLPIASDSDIAYQKLNSLIQTTGNPLLDSEISKTLSGLTRPTQFTFKCSLQTTVAQAEQVNQWISELTNV